MAVRNATKIIASGLLLVTLTGCATASLQQRRAQWSKADDAPVSDTVFEADDSTCQNVADDKSRGLAVAGISTAAASLFGAKRSPSDAGDSATFVRGAP
jgi:hypothetical protein